MCSFFTWLEKHDIGGLADVEPMHLALYMETLYMETLQETAAKPTVTQHLAAIRMLFDWLVVGQILATNPAHSVRGPKSVVRRGKTPFLTEDQARRLLVGLETVVCLRDPAVIGMMTYTFDRIGAVVGMRVEDYYPQGKRSWVRLQEAARDAGSPQAGGLPRRIYRRCRHRWAMLMAIVIHVYGRLPIWALIGSRPLCNTACWLRRTSCLQHLAFTISRAF